MMMSLIDLSGYRSFSILISRRLHGLIWSFL